MLLLVHLYFFCKNYVYLLPILKPNPQKKSVMYYAPILHPSLPLQNRTLFFITTATVITYKWLCIITNFQKTFLARFSLPVIETGRFFGTAGFLPTVANVGESTASSSDRTASSRLPSEIEKFSRATVTGSLRNVTISDSTNAKQSHAKRKR